MANNYPKVDYKSMGKSLTGDVQESYRSPGEDYGPDITPNPYEYGSAQHIESGAYDNKFAGQNQALAGKLMGLGNKDYSGELNVLSQKGIDKQYDLQKAKLNALGMGELQLRGDVQDEWSERRGDAATRAKIQGPRCRGPGWQRRSPGFRP